MCINKDLEQMIHERGVAFIPTVEEAIAEQKEYEATLRRLLDTITPDIGRSMAVTLSDAFSDVRGCSARQILARLAVIMEAVLGGGEGQVFLTPVPEEEEA